VRGHRSQMSCETMGSCESTSDSKVLGPDDASNSG